MDLAGQVKIEYEAGTLGGPSDPPAPAECDFT